MAKLSHTPIAPQSAQRESNPHFRHGKAVGCRYIMGACRLDKLSKNVKAPGGTRTLVAALRVRCPCRWTTSACVSAGPEGLEPSPARLRAGDAAANTLVPFKSCFRSRRGGNRTLDLTLIRGPLSPLSYAPQREWGRRESNPHLPD